MSELNYKVIIGLEIHVQLCTQSKMFCGCAVEFGAEPNSRVCPVCLGMPGVLPVMNKQAVDYAILTALALNCEVARFTKWDRKNYYYPDLPKNYQISQYDLPLGRDGFIEIPLETGGTKRIGIIRAHLEEDAGKNLHTAEGYSQVDLNRTGTPLLEIVTQPDLSSPQEVRILAIQLQQIVRYLGVSEADMQKGHMRFEPNINLEVTRDGRPRRTPIVEIKNLNSFRALERSLAYEIDRQLDEFAETGKEHQMGTKTTRGWDDVAEATVLQREKEEAHDYRYFPEPDLVPVKIDDRWLDTIRSRLCEMPLQKQRRFVNEYDLSEYDAGVLTAERSTAEFFDAAVTAGGEAKRVCNLLTQTGLKLANEAGCSFPELGVAPDALAELAKMTAEGTVSASAASTILEEMVKTGRSAADVADRLSLTQKSDAAELEGIVDEVLAENARAVSDAASAGKKSKAAKGFLVGQVMKKTGGRANPKIVQEILGRKLK